jgi:hypothetical protein
MLFAMRVAVVLIAWTALLLPWERCHDLCHDQLLPALAEHDCHGHTCEDDADAEPCGGKARHETVQFVSLRPDAKVHLDAAALVQVAARAFAPVGSAARAHPAFDHDPAPDLLRTTVLLL